MPRSLFRKGQRKHAIFRPKSDASKIGRLIFITAKHQGATQVRCERPCAPNSFKKTPMARQDFTLESTGQFFISALHKMLHG
jgi:hypothetical protein